MLMLPQILSINTTDKCTSQCANCCFKCSPSGKNMLSEEMIISAIENAKEIPSIRVIVFTGGESFLLGRTLDMAVEYASQSKFSTRVVSNGYWADTRKSAMERLLPLHKAGLNELCLSTGPEHQEFVRIDSIINAAVSAADLGMQVAIMVEAFKGARVHLKPLLRDSDAQKYLENGEIIIKPSPWMRVATDDIEHNDKFRERFHNLRIPCESVLSSISVEPDASLMACCGLSSRGKSELRIGSLKNSSMKQLIADAPNDLIKIWMNVAGPLDVLDYVMKKNPLIMIPSNVVHHCDICRFIYEDDRVRQVLLSELPARGLELMEVYKKRMLVPKLQDTLEEDLGYIRDFSTVEKALESLSVAGVEVY